MSALTEYEQARARRVAENAVRLQSLMKGIEHPLETVEAPPTVRSHHRAKDPADIPRERVSTRNMKKINYRDVDLREPALGRRTNTVRSRGSYETVDATTCHFCRQKTNSYKAECTACSLRWCAPCLRARCGEDAHAVNATGAWECLKCLGNCNCSACRRRNGLLPTGPLAVIAQEAGFASVNAYLASMHVN